MSNVIGDRVVEFELNGRAVTVPAGGSLLDALRESLAVRSVKDGCSPQGQCGCCTVWVDGQPRVSCVTPVARVAGRAVTTVEGLADREMWAAAFADHYGFVIDVLAAYRPTGKGRVERQVNIVREHVITGRRFGSIGDLDGAFAAWLPIRRAHDGARRNSPGMLIEVPHSGRVSL